MYGLCYFDGTGKIEQNNSAAKRLWEYHQQKPDKPWELS